MKYQEAISFLCDNDSIMKNIIERVGECNLEPSDTYFKNILESIISQQLSLGAAKTIWSRLETLIKGNFTPEEILKIDHQDLRNVGLSNQKAKYVKEVSNYFISNPDFESKITEMSDEQIISELTSIKGIGTWTAQMFLMFSLCRENVLPIADVGFKRALKIHYNIQGDVDCDSINKVSENWGKYKTIAVWYLWKALE